MRSTDRSVSLLRVLVPLFSLVIAHVTSLIQLPNLQLLQSPHGGKYSVPSWSALTNNLAGCPSDTYILTTFKVKTVESPRLEWVPARVGSPIDELEALQLVSMEGLNMDSAHSAYVELDDIAVRVLQEQGLEGMKQLLERKCGAKSMVLDLKGMSR